VRIRQIGPKKSVSFGFLGEEKGSGRRILEGRGKKIENFVKKTLTV